MGMDANFLKFLFAAKQRGVSFRRTITIGRLELTIPRRPLQNLLSQFGLNLSDEQIEELYTRAGGYADALLTLLGAESVESLDASPFEGATVVHDMNNPIPDQFQRSFDAVIDGGSLEHVFNFPVAVRNCMEMVGDGGHFLGLNPGNSFMGHGFYQISPELYFRVFSPANGFRVERLVAYRNGGRTWYEVADPAEVGCRVTLASRHPVLLAVCARKAAHVPIFSSWPQQSDYAAKWSQFADRPVVRTPRLASQTVLRGAVRNLKKIVAPEFPQKFYRRVA